MICGAELEEGGEDVGDGYAGSYYLDGNGEAFVLDGNGNYVHGLDCGTYVIKDNIITIAAAQYEIDLDNKKLKTLSVFAGRIFYGGYVDRLYGENHSIAIKFNKSSSISGRLYIDGVYSSNYLDFVARLSGNNIVFVFNSVSASIDGDAVGSNLYGIISEDAIAFTSCSIQNELYSFANNGSVKCDGFSL